MARVLCGYCGASAGLVRCEADLLGPGKCALRMFRTTALFVALAGILFLSANALAQDVQPIHEGTFEFGVWAGGGTGVGERSQTKFFNTGVRLGKVLTG